MSLGAGDRLREQRSSGLVRQAVRVEPDHQQLGLAGGIAAKHEHPTSAVIETIAATQAVTLPVFRVGTHAEARASDASRILATMVAKGRYGLVSKIDGRILEDRDAVADQRLVASPHGSPQRARGGIRRDV